MRSQDNEDADAYTANPCSTSMASNLQSLSLKHAANLRSVRFDAFVKAGTPDETTPPSCSSAGWDMRSNGDATLRCLFANPERRKPMRLYHSSGSPNSRRVRILIAEKGLDIEMVPVDLGAKEQFSDA
jgi:hypothetical protein